MVSTDYRAVLAAFGLAVAVVLAGCKKESPPEPQPEPPAAAETTAAPAPSAPETAAPAEPPVIRSVEPGTQPSPEPSAPVVESAEIVPLVGAKPVKFGMTKDQVIEVMGEPEKMEGGGIAMFYPASHGLTVVVDPISGVKQIQCWSQQYPLKPPDSTIKTFAGRTDKGIGMGSARQDVIAAYGQPDQTGSRGPCETLRYNGIKTTFEIFQDKVVAITLGAP